jgi:hypothetical protein
MSKDHTGNISPAVEYEEHISKGAINAKRAALYGYIPGNDSLVPITAVDNGDGTYSFRSSTTANAGAVSTNNGSTTPLAGAGVYTGTGEDVSGYSEMRVTVFTSHASATDGLSIQQSSDNTNWDITDTYTMPAMTAGNGKTFVVPRQAKFFRVVYTNGATLQTAFRLAVILNRAGTAPSSNRAGDGYSNETDLVQNQVFLMGLNQATSVWDRIRTVGTGLLASAAAVLRATIQASAAQTASINSSALTTIAPYREANFYLNVTAFSGTSPTLNVKIQTSDDGGTTWYDLMYPNSSIPVAFTQVVGITNQVLSVAGNIGDTIRAVSTIAGTTPSFTYAIKGVFKS